MPDDLMQRLAKAQRKGDLVIVEVVDQIDTAQWTPPNGSRPTQVHVMLAGPKDSKMVLMRFKGPDTIRKLIAQLTQQADEVWPDKESQ